jgi:uncharacterized membrane protein YkvA (DUF1232 family)
MWKPTGMIDGLKRNAIRLHKEIYALYLAYKDPRVPFLAKFVSACVIAYALSPIDLIPDFIPVLGYLDDLILLPLGIALALRMIPPAVMAECREKTSDRWTHDPPKSRAGVVAVIAIWILVLGLSGACIAWLFHAYGS